MPENKTISIQNAAKEYADNLGHKETWPTVWEERYNCFIAGAEFQKSQPPVKELYELSLGDLKILREDYRGLHQFPKIVEAIENFHNNLNL